jgi:hypothetical protein
MIAIYKEHCFGICLQGLRKIIRLPIVILYVSIANMKIVQSAVACPFFSAE